MHVCMCVRTNLRLQGEWNSLKRKKFLPTNYVVLLQRPMPSCLADSKARREGAWREKGFCDLKGA